MARASRRETSAISIATNTATALTAALARASQSETSAISIATNTTTALTVPLARASQSETSAISIVTNTATALTAGVAPASRGETVACLRPRFIRQPEGRHYYACDTYAEFLQRGAARHRLGHAFC